MFAKWRRKHYKVIQKLFFHKTQLIVLYHLSAILSRELWKKLEMEPVVRSQHFPINCPLLFSWQNGVLKTNLICFINRSFRSKYPPPPNPIYFQIPLADCRGLCNTKRKVRTNFEVKRSTEIMRPLL